MRRQDHRYYQIFNRWLRYQPTNFHLFGRSLLHSCYYKVCIYPKTPSFMGFDESTWISCVNETYAICLPRILKILFIGGQCDKSMSRGSNLCNSDGIGVGTAYCVMEYGDESLTLTVCWIIKVWSEYRIGSRFSSRKRKVCLYDCMYMYIHKEPTHESGERQAWGRTPFEVNTNYFLFIFNRCQSPFLILFFDAPCFILLCFLFVLFVWIGWGWCGWGDYSADQYCRAVGSSVSKMVSVDGPSIQKRKCSIPNQLTLCFSLVPSTFLSSYSFFWKVFFCPSRLFLLRVELLHARSWALDCLVLCRAPSSKVLLVQQTSLDLL